MLDIWFIAGVALGTLVTGFCAIGSFERGSDSVQRRSWNREYAARRGALLASRQAVSKVAQADLKGALTQAV